MPLSQVQAYGRRIAAMFARVGETFELVRASRNRTAVGLFAPMDGQTTGIYFDSNEAVGLLRPALTLHTDGAAPDPPLPGDLFFRDGRLWTVRKTQVFRHGGTALLVLALCD